MLPGGELLQFEEEVIRRVGGDKRLLISAFEPFVFRDGGWHVPRVASAGHHERPRQTLSMQWGVGGRDRLRWL